MICELLECVAGRFVGDLEGLCNGCSGEHGPSSLLARVVERRERQLFRLLLTLCPVRCCLTLDCHTGLLLVVISHVRGTFVGHWPI